MYKLVFYQVIEKLSKKLNIDRNLVKIAIFSFGSTIEFHRPNRKTSNDKLLYCLNLSRFSHGFSALSTWNLPAAIEDVGGLNKVPQSLLDKSQTIKDKGGISKIDSMTAELPPLLQRNREILDEAKRCLQEEEQSDTELRTSMKDKWTRTPSRQLTEYLHAEIKQYEQIIENAIKANKVIDTKYMQNKDCIQLLSKSSHEISTALPAATAAGALKDTHIIKV